MKRQTEKGKNTLVVKIAQKSKVIPLFFSHFAMALMVVFDN
jgi:hypothetical protein